LDQFDFDQFQEQNQSIGQSDEPSVSTLVQEQNQSIGQSDEPSVSTLVDMIHNHPSCKEVIQLLLSDEQCLSHIRDHFAMNPLIAAQASFNNASTDWSKCVQP
jgi:hypothetical protein